MRRKCIILGVLVVGIARLHAQVEPMVHETQGITETALQALAKVVETANPDFTLTHYPDTLWFPVGDSLYAFWSLAYGNYPATPYETAYRIATGSPLSSAGAKPYRWPTATSSRLWDRLLSVGLMSAALAALLTWLLMSPAYKSWHAEVLWKKRRERRNVNRLKPLHEERWLITSDPGGTFDLIRSFVREAELDPNDITMVQCGRLVNHGNPERITVGVEGKVPDDATWDAMLIELPESLWLVAIAAAGKPERVLYFLKTGHRVLSENGKDDFVPPTSTIFIPTWERDVNGEVRSCELPDGMPHLVSAAGTSVDGPAIASTSGGSRPEVTIIVTERPLEGGGMEWTATSNVPRQDIHEFTFSSKSGVATFKPRIPREVSGHYSPF